MLIPALLALAAAQAPDPQVLRNPTWITPPVISFGRTTRNRRSIPPGEVEIMCTAAADGRLEDCRIVAEHDGSAALRRAALQAAGRARVAPRTIDGGPVPSEVVFRISVGAPVSP